MERDVFLSPLFPPRSLPNRFDRFQRDIDDDDDSFKDETFIEKLLGSGRTIQCTIFHDQYVAMGYRGPGLEDSKWRGATTFSFLSSLL